MKHIRAHSPFQPRPPDPRPPEPRERSNSAARKTGVLVDWNPDKQFGWIKPDAGGQDIFMHARQVEASRVGQLSVGDRLSFSVKFGDGGKFSAQELRLL